jgi:hypothetical protein
MSTQISNTIESQGRTQISNPNWNQAKILVGSKIRDQVWSKSKKFINLNTIYETY